MNRSIYLLATVTAALHATVAYAQIDDTVKVRGDRVEQEADAQRSSVTTSRRDLDERQPRSTPEAMRYVPGVYVQQTAHGQGSPYIRGRTGQQTEFDCF